MRIYLDETGNLTKADGAFFIVASVSVGDPRRVVNAFRRLQHNKFSKSLRSSSEVKFNNSSLSDSQRRKMLQALVDQDIRIFYTYLATSNIPNEYMQKDKVYESGLLYLEVVESTLELYLPLTTNEFRVFRDKRTTKGMTAKIFNDTLRTSLLPKLPADVLCQVDDIDSATNPMIQVADWICGALGRYHEGKEGGQEFYDILRPYIVQQKELFSRLRD